MSYEGEELCGVDGGGPGFAPSAPLYQKSIGGEDNALGDQFYRPLLFAVRLYKSTLRAIFDASIQESTKC